MLLNATRSCLLIVDVQERLAPAINDGEAVISSIAWLAAIAEQLDIPVHATEQYPKGLGPTVSPLQCYLASDCLHQKMHFSWMQTDASHTVKNTYPQWVVTGTEAHVCVQQTVLEACALDHTVFVVDEAVGSRRALDKQRALERMRRAGAHIVTREMVAFEWLRRADTDTFRAIQPLLRDGPEAL